MLLHLVKRGVVLGAATACIVAMAGSTNALLITEVESNNSILTAQNVDAFFSLGYNVDVDYYDFGWHNQSTTVPWVSIQGGGDNSVDYYSFTIGAGKVGYFDIDYGTGMDAEIALWSSAGGFPLLAEADGGPNGDSGSVWGSFDSYLHYTFTEAGLYVIGVAEWAARPWHGGWDMLNTNRLDVGDSYTLQISVMDHVIPEPGTLGLLGMGALGLLAGDWRRRR